MSNAIEFYHPDKDKLGVPAGRSVIFLDGVLCGFLKVKRIEREANAGGSSAVLEYDVSALDEVSVCPVEDIESIAPMGAQVSIRQLYNAGVGEVQVESVSIFEGHIENIRTKISGSCESVEITARDFTASMDRITVFGRRYADELDGSRFMVGMKAVFNEDGEGNARKQTVTCNGKSYKVFEADSGNAKLWSYGQILHYLLSEYLLVGLVGVPTSEELEMVTGYTIADEINLEGKSLSVALELCCKKTGVEFVVEPVLCESGPASRVVFYRLGMRGSVELNHQYAGEGLDISRTNILSVDSDRERWPVTDRSVVKGGFKKYESTFDLAEMWDSSLEGLAQSEYGQSTSSDFESVRDVYRKWCLDEAFDFSNVFEGEKFLQRPRLFEKALTKDSDGVSMGYYLEVSFDNGVNWQEYLDSFSVLDDQCGVWLSSDELSAAMWTAIGAGTLKFRITASVTSDSRVSYTVSNGAVGGCGSVVDDVETDEGFQYCRVMPTSVLYDQVNNGQLESDEVDDSNLIAAYCNNKARLNERIIERIETQTAILGMHYLPGQRIVCSPDSRDVLGVRRDARSEFVIESIIIDFDRQATGLEIVRRRKY